ncbi:hypothetical protein D3C80_1274090 [compost metagenome]
MPVFGQVNQHIVLAAFEGIHQRAIQTELLKPAFFAPVAAYRMYLINMRMAGEHRLGVVIHQCVNFDVWPVFFQYGKDRRGQQNVTVVTQLDDQHALGWALR